MTSPTIDELIEAGEIKEYPDGALRWVAGNRYFNHPGTFVMKPDYANTFASDDATSEAGKAGGSITDKEAYANRAKKIR